MPTDACIYFLIASAVAGNYDPSWATAVCFVPTGLFHVLLPKPTHRAAARLVSSPDIGGRALELRSERGLEQSNSAGF